MNKINNLRILHIFAPNFRVRFSGQAVWWKTIFRRWNSAGIVHYVLDWESNLMVEGNKVFSFEYPNQQVAISRWKRGVWIIRLFQCLVHYKGEYDIIHIHVLWWGSLLIGPWAKLNNVPTIFESVLLGGDTPCGIIKEKLPNLKLYCIKSYSAILTISDYLKIDYVNHGFDNDKVFTLVDCTDIDLFRPAKCSDEKTYLRKCYSIPSSLHILLFVGSVIPRKGVDNLIKAFIDANKVNPNLYLIIAGPKSISENPIISTSYVESLYDLLDQYDLGKRVLFTGLIQDRGKLAEFYRLSDIFTFPSRNEGLGNVVLEAMATELPIIVSHLPVLNNIVKHGENGVTVPINDIDTLRDAILLVANNVNLAKELGRSARKYVEENHGYMSWSTELTRIYNALFK